MSEEWPLIYRYSRADAFDDGELVDVSDTAREAGFRLPTAVTRTVWERCVATGHGECFERGRLWDVLWCASLAARRGGETDRVTFTLKVKGGDGRGRLERLVCHIGPGDTREPVVTVMFPEDD